MVDLWEKRLKDLTGLTLTDLRTHTIKELTQKLPSHLQNDPDIKPFLWKLSIYITQHHPRQTKAQEQELQDLYNRIQKRLEDIPVYLRRRPKT